MNWLWETYQIRAGLDGDVNESVANSDTYYSKNIKILNTQLESAGLHLAYLLNSIFTKQTSQTLKYSDYEGLMEYKTDSNRRFSFDVEFDDLPKRIGKLALVKGKVYGHLNTDSVIYVYLGGNYPKQKATLILKGKAKFFVQDQAIDNKLISISGNVTNYNGKPAIEIKSPLSINVQK